MPKRLLRRLQRFPHANSNSAFYLLRKKFRFARDCHFSGGKFARLLMAVCVLQRNTRRDYLSEKPNHMAEAERLVT